MKTVKIKKWIQKVGQTLFNKPKGDGNGKYEKAYKSILKWKISESTIKMA